MKFSAPSTLALVAPLLSTLVGASPLVSTEGASHLERRIQSGAPHFVAYCKTQHPLTVYFSGANSMFKSQGTLGSAARMDPPATSQLTGFNNLCVYNLN